MTEEEDRSPEKEGMSLIKQYGLNSSMACQSVAKQSKGFLITTQENNETSNPISVASEGKLATLIALPTPSTIKLEI